MALVKGTNSYVTVAEFKAYFADRIDVSAAISASDASIAQALVSATDILNELSWTGVIEDPLQSLSFPRIGSYFDPKLGGRAYLSGVPSRVVQGCMEQAYHLLNNEGLQDSTGSIHDLSVGTINLTKIQAASLMSSKVKTIIKPLLINTGASPWWRAN